MKNTLLFLLVSLLLAVSLTACGGGGTGTTDGSVNGTEDYRGDYNNDGYDDNDRYDDGLMGDARDAVDDAGRSVRNAVDDAGNAIDRAF